MWEADKTVDRGASPECCPLLKLGAEEETIVGSAMSHKKNELALAFLWTIKEGAKSVGEEGLSLEDDEPGLW